MGACYSTSIEFDVKDENKFLELAKSFISNNEKNGVRFADKADRNTVKGILETIFTRSEAQFKNDGKHYHYHSDFDACYSWESIMYDFFEAVASSIKDGSSLYISSDNDKYSLAVQGGSVV